MWQPDRQKPITDNRRTDRDHTGCHPHENAATGGHPAKRTFQAIRIELNRELDVLRDSLDGMIDLLMMEEESVLLLSILWKTGS